MNTYYSVLAAIDAVINIALAEVGYLERLPGLICTTKLPTRATKLYEIWI